MAKVRLVGGPCDDETVEDEGLLLIARDVSMPRRAHLMDPPRPVRIERHVYRRRTYAKANGTIVRVEYAHSSLLGSEQPVRTEIRRLDKNDQPM